MKNTNYIKILDGAVQAQLDVIIYSDQEGITYAYAPALDLTGYGTDVQEAKSSFEIVIEDYFEYGIKRNTLKPDLLAHGWKSVDETDFSFPKAWNLFRTNKQMQDIYSGSFSKLSYPVSYAAN